MIFRLKACILAAALMLVAALPATAFETRARAAMVVDYNTGTVLLAKNADEAMPPASMSKLMTLNMVFEALEDGRLLLDEKLSVSAHAMSYGGSTMFLTTRDRVKVEDLIRGVIVLSGNDACAVLAEALAGSEAEFAKSMNNRAVELGMLESTFANSNGWPHPNQRMSARDLVFLATRLIKEFPQYYGYFAETEFAFDNRAPDNRNNRNPLLKLDIGADGLKTGHTSEAGYGVVGSASRSGRRIVVMITGLESEAARSDEAEKLLNWAFRQFVQKKILESGQEVARASVWLGAERSVALSVAVPIDLLIPASTGGKLESEIIYNEPIEAPIAKGQVLGKLVVTVPDLGVKTYDLVASEAVAAGGLSQKLKTSAAILMRKVLGE